MTDLLNGSVSRDRWLAYQAAAIVAFVLLTLTSVRPIEIGAAVAATGLLVASRLAGSWSDPETRTLAFALSSAGLLLVVGVVAGPWRPYILVTSVFILPLALAAGVLAWRGKVEDRGLRLLVTGILVSIVVVIGVLWIPAVKPPATDMLYLHESAAEVMLDGRNPYSDAYAVSTNPFAPAGAEYIGYAYPPLTMIAYAGSHILFGDSRWASVIAMVVVIVLITRPWEAMTRRQAGALIALGLAVVVQPWLGTVIYFGWTDPITLPLLLAGALLWRRHPVLAAVLFGLAFGTKQYLVLALPVMLAYNDDYRWKRTLIAGGVAALTLVPFALLDPVAFYNATIAVSVAAPIRLDSSGLAGLGLDLPLWLVAGLSLGIAAWMGHRGGGAARFLLALSATLAVVFLIGFQAFMNYWFFVAAVGLFAVVVSVKSPGGDESDPSLEMSPRLQIDR